MPDTLLSCLVREADALDAPELWELARTADAQSPFLIYAPGEREADPAGRRLLAEAILAEHVAVIVAELPDGLAGYLLAYRGRLARTAHCARIATLAVLARHQGRGIGRGLLARFEAWAGERGCTRLELEVMTGNARARRLYAAMGYVEEGLRRGAYLLPDGPEDAVLMAKRQI